MAFTLNFQHQAFHSLCKSQETAQNPVAAPELFSFFLFFFFCGALRGQKSFEGQKSKKLLKIADFCHIFLQIGAPPTGKCLLCSSLMLPLSKPLPFLQRMEYFLKMTRNSLYQTIGFTIFHCQFCVESY